MKFLNYFLQDNCGLGGKLYKSPMAPDKRRHCIYSSILHIMHRRRFYSSCITLRYLKIVRDILQVFDVEIGRNVFFGKLSRYLKQLP